MDIATATTEDLERLWDDANRQENFDLTDRISAELSIRYKEANALTFCKGEQPDACCDCAACIDYFSRAKS